MALALLAQFSGSLRACGGGFVDAARPVRPKLQLAVGFDAGCAWISAQCGELAIRKLTRLEPHETTIAVQHEADMVSVIVGLIGLAVVRSATRIDVDCEEALIASRRLLTGSPALLAAMGIRAELEEVTDVRGPEISLLSSMEFLAALVRHGKAANGIPRRRAYPQADMMRHDRWFGSGSRRRHSRARWNVLRWEWTRFLNAEFAWLRALGSIGPLQLRTFPIAPGTVGCGCPVSEGIGWPHTLDRPAVDTARCGVAAVVPACGCSLSADPPGARRVR